MPTWGAAWADQHPASIVIVLIALFWIAASAVLSMGGGWFALGRRFRVAKDFAGASWRWQSAQMRWIASYHNCITVGANPEGLYVAPFFPFRLAHPPLFIPWSEISHSRSTILFAPKTCFQLGSDLQVPFWVPEELGLRIQEAAGNSWPAETLA